MRRLVHRVSDAVAALPWVVAVTALAVWLGVITATACLAVAT